MIIALTSEVEVGKVYKMDFLDPPTLYADHPVMILREATEDEWRNDDRHMDLTPDEVEQKLRHIKSRITIAGFYEVSVD